MDMTVGQDRIFVHQECDRITVLIHVCMPYKKIKNEKSLKLLFAVYVIGAFIPRLFFKTAGGIGMAAVFAGLSHVWPYISVANKDRVLKFKICSKQTKMYLKIFFSFSRPIRLVSLKKKKFCCADTLAETT